MVVGFFYESASMGFRSGKSFAGFVFIKKTDVNKPEDISLEGGVHGRYNERCLDYPIQIKFTGTWLLFQLQALKDLHNWLGRSIAHFERRKDME